jgi:hypothetical protein
MYGSLRRNRRAPRRRWALVLGGAGLAGGAGLGGASYARQSTATSSEIEIPSARRVPEADVLASSITGKSSDTDTRCSRTTLMSGNELRCAAVPSAAGASSRVTVPTGRLRRARHHSKPRDARDEQQARDQQNEAQLAHGTRAHQAVAMRTASSTSTDTRREQPGSVIVTPSSCEASSIVALLCVMKMNCTRSDICFHDVAEAADVVLVERRVDFVQQAERRGIQVEDREHQRDGGERLLATRELVDAAVALARRARHHGHAGRERIFAHQFQVGVAAAEQLGNFLLQAGVDAIERVLEACARFLARSCASPLRAC